MALADAIKQADEAELALKAYNDNLPSLEKDWISKRIQSCVGEVVKELDKVYQQGYDFALYKLNLAPDHELRIAAARSFEPSNDDKEEEDEEVQTDEGDGVQNVGAPS